MIKSFTPDQQPPADEPSSEEEQASSAPVKKPSRRKQRRYARERATQALYQQILNPTAVDRLEAEFMEDPFMLRVDLGFFRGIIRGVDQHAAQLDASITPHLDRPIEELDPIEHAVLRLGAYELAHEPETPRAIVINESVELAKRFGASEAHRYINGVLDQLADELRPHEPRRRA